MTKTTKKLSSNTLSYIWVVNDLILTIYPNITDYDRECRRSNSGVQIITRNHGCERFKLNFIVKDFDIIIDGTTYDHHEIAKRLKTPNIELYIPDIDINKDHNIFYYENGNLPSFRKLQ